MSASDMPSTGERAWPSTPGSACVTSHSGLGGDVELPFWSGLEELWLPVWHLVGGGWREFVGVTT
jgi:hypothetical protein